MISIKECILRPRKYFGVALFDKFSSHIHNDELFLKIRFWLKMGRKLDLKNPKTYNEKLQWLKLYDRKPEYTTMVDKYAVKEYVARIIGEQFVIPTLGVWDNFDEINFDKLPNQFVLKATNGGGGSGVIICEDKSKLNIKATKLRLNNSLKEDIYTNLREWQYKNVKHRIIAEKLLVDKEHVSLNDYKVMTFGGEPKLMEMHIDRFSAHHTQDFYSLPDWKKTNITQSGYSDSSSIILPKPKCLDKMLELSSLLSKNIPHCRVDWYLVNGKLYFGEITFYDASGFCAFDKMEDELLLGSWIDLSKVGS